jgi:hypothetical protein
MEVAREEPRERMERGKSSDCCQLDQHIRLDVMISGSEGDGMGWERCVGIDYGALVLGALTGRYQGQ